MTAPTEGGSLISRMKGFNRDFWTINGIELLERGAYYSLAPVFTIFMLAIFRQSMTEAEAGALAGAIGSLLLFLLYGVPIMSVPFSEKYGYRAALFASFGFLTLGYVGVFVASSTWMIVAAAVSVGVGAGIFKPIAAAMVSQTTEESQRGTAFAIYYGCINLGALIFPTSVGIAANVFGTGLESSIAFAVAATLSALNLVLVLLVFRNVNPPRRDMKVGQAFALLGDVFRHPSFLVLLVIYSGFWFMYALNLGFLQAYMVDFARMPTWFTPTFVTALNALVIIVCAPLIAVLTNRFSGLALITVGILGYSVGLMVLGFSTTPVLFISGVLMFSLFELVTHPSYLAYVSKVAPPDKVSAYLGYGFIPIAVGLTLGNSVGGALYGQIARTEGQPFVFWAIISAVGLATVAALLVYNFVITTMRARRAGTPVATTKRASTMRWVAGPVGALALVLVIPMLVAGATFAGTNTGGEGPLGPLSTDDALAAVTMDPIEDATDEGARTSKTITLPAEATGAGAFVLSWTDETGGPGTINAPDTLRLHVTLPNGTMLMSEESDAGEISLPFDAAPGDYVVEVEVVDAGDTSVGFGPVTLPGGAGGSEDTGNGWTLEASYQTPSTA